MTTPGAVGVIAPESALRASTEKEYGSRSQQPFDRDHDAWVCITGHRHALKQRPLFGIMWVIFDHLRPSGHIMPDHAGDRGAACMVLAPHDHLYIMQSRTSCRRCGPRRSPRSVAVEEVRPEVVLPPVTADPAPLKPTTPGRFSYALWHRWLQPAPRTQDGRWAGLRCEIGLGLAEVAGAAGGLELFPAAGRPPRRGTSTSATRSG
jgi:hypothetical protein